MDRPAHLHAGQRQRWGMRRLLRQRGHGITDMQRATLKSLPNESLATPPAAVHGGPKGALPYTHACPTIQGRTKDSQPPWRRHGRGCGDRVKGPWRALSVPPRQDVASGRPGRSGPGHGLPEGRLRGGALSLVPFFGQAKKGTRPRRCGLFEVRRLWRAKQRASLSAC